jgi:hypothetical protein
VAVLSRADGGYKDGDSDIPAAQLEKERKEGQAKLVLLSSNSKQVIVHSGHNMNLEAPEDVTNAIREVVNAVRHHRRLKKSEIGPDSVAVVARLVPPWRSLHRETQLHHLQRTLRPGPEVVPPVGADRLDSFEKVVLSRAQRLPANLVTSE